MKKKLEAIMMHWNDEAMPSVSSQVSGNMAQTMKTHAIQSGIYFHLWQGYKNYGFNLVLFQRFSCKCHGG